MALLQAVDYTPLPEDTRSFTPLTLDVVYRGEQTISTLMSDYEGRKYAPIDDKVLRIRLFGTFRIPVVFIPLGELGPKKMRGLNIPETLELGRRMQKKILFGLGQIVQGQFDKQHLYVFRMGAGLFPCDRVRDSWQTVPATQTPDPLA